MSAVSIRAYQPPVRYQYDFRNGYRYNNVNNYFPFGDRINAILGRSIIYHHDPVVPRFSHNKDAVATSTPTIADQYIWALYDKSMREIAHMDRVVKHCSVADQKPVQEYLLSNTAMLDLPSLECRDQDFRELVKEQKSRFLNITGFSSEQLEYCTRCLSYMGDRCAKMKSTEPALVAWYKLRESGIVPRERFVSTYMYVFADLVDDCAQVATYHDLLFEPNEKTVYLRIKSLIAKGNASGAEHFLRCLPNKGKSSEWKRLRTFSPILRHFCATHDMTSCLRLFREMRDSEGVLFDAETYALILGSVARCGYFRMDSPVIPAATDYGLAASSGPALLDCLASEMAEDLLELTPWAARMIYNDFISGFAVDHNQSFLEDSDNAFTWTDLGHLSIGRVSVNETTAICPETGAKLRLFGLTANQRRSVHDTLLEMAGTQHEEFSEKLKARGEKVKVRGDSDRARQNLLEFSTWLTEREGEPYTAIVDGPNVAYAGHGDVHYSQIKLVVDELERMGERPLVVMPTKYIASRFFLSSLETTQSLSDKDIGIMNGLLESGKMYAVPAACLDDYYWMLASVARQTDFEFEVTIENGQGRFPGLRPILITNDQMRDHKLALIERRLFRRWMSCHIVNYFIKPYVNDEWEEREVRLLPADFFSREIQGNEAEGLGHDTAWHFPVSEWDKHDRLCIRIQT
jgi:pentatricopeptide repeat protein